MFLFDVLILGYSHTFIYHFILWVLQFFKICTAISRYCYVTAIYAICDYNCEHGRYLNPWFLVKHYKHGLAFLWLGHHNIIWHVYELVNLYSISFFSDNLETAIEMATTHLFILLDSSANTNRCELNNKMPLGYRK